MAAIRPLKGLRFSADAGDLDSLTAPPYDVLSPAQREEFSVRNPRNVVHLTLPEAKADDRSKFVKYARSAALLSEWRRDNALVVEEKPAIYRYTQHFSLPGIPKAYSRTAIIALIKVEPYEKGVVLPHEQTFPKHKEDRMRILEATRSHLECIFGLYEDPAGEVLEAIQTAPAGAKAETKSGEGVLHELEPITDEPSVQRLVDLLADKKVWIADGHHRYETAVAYRQTQGEKDEPIPEDYMMMALSSMSDPGLVLLPTHRVLSVLPYGTQETLAKLNELFDLHETHSSRLTQALDQAEQEGKTVFCAAFEGGRGFVMTPKDPAALASMAGEEGSESLRALDVTILHRVILEKLLGVQGLDNITYTRDPQEAILLADQGAAVSFLMNPPTVEDMKKIALGGEKMPQKSTYYFPKILSGLVIWSLNDF